MLRKTKSFITVFAFFFAGQAFANDDNSSCQSSATIEQIDDVRTAHEEDILAIDGVNGLGYGFCDDYFPGDLCLKIYTEVEEAKDSLLEAYPDYCIDQVPYKIEHLGPVEPQLK